VFILESGLKSGDILAEVFPLLAAGIISHPGPADYFDQPVAGEEIAGYLERVSAFRKSTTRRGLSVWEH